MFFRLGETCSHVGALLFKIEAAVRFGHTSAACTDLPCKWNATFKKNVQAAEISSIKFYKDAAHQKCLRSKQGHSNKARSPSSPHQEKAFISGLDSILKSAVGLTSFGDYRKKSNRNPNPSNQVLFPQPLRHVFQEKYRCISPDDLCQSVNDLYSSLTVAKLMIEAVEAASRGQSASRLWHEQRAGRITASMAHSFLHTDINRPAPSLVKKYCIPSLVPLKQ